MKRDLVIEELNTLLRGHYMGIRSFEHYIQKLEDEELRTRFQHMQQEVKHNAAKVAERIQNLGGVPADDEGFTGSLHSFMGKMMLPDSTDGIIENAIMGEDRYGVQYSEELVKGDLDPESKKIVEEVLDVNRRHVEQLNRLLR